jgi:hypothetical protein
MQCAAQQKWTFNLKRQEQVALALKFQALPQQVLHLYVVVLMLRLRRLEMIVADRIVERKTVTPQPYLLMPNSPKVGWWPEWTVQLVQEK